MAAALRPVCQPTDGDRLMFLGIHWCKPQTRRCAPHRDASLRTAIPRCAALTHRSRLSIKRAPHPDTALRGEAGDNSSATHRPALQPRALLCHATPCDATLSHRCRSTIKTVLNPTQAFVLKVGTHRSFAPLRYPAHCVALHRTAIAVGPRPRPSPKPYGVNPCPKFQNSFSKLASISTP